MLICTITTLFVGAAVGAVVSAALILALAYKLG